MSKAYYELTVEFDDATEEPTSGQLVVYTSGSPDGDEACGTKTLDGKSAMRLAMAWTTAMAIIAPGAYDTTCPE